MIKQTHYGKICGVHIDKQRGGKRSVCAGFIGMPRVGADNRGNVRVRRMQTARKRIEGMERHCKGWVTFG